MTHCFARRSAPRRRTQDRLEHAADKLKSIQSAGKLLFAQAPVLERTPQNAAHLVNLLIVDDPVPAALQRRELVIHSFTHRRAPFGESIANRPAV
jgi:hypothetical protein